MGESLAVISALQRLHNPLASAADIEASDNFLIEFQKSPQSWQARGQPISDTHDLRKFVGNANL